MTSRGKIVVSACLAGLECRYDCAHKKVPEVVALVRAGIAIPLCPEQMGGLSTPREAAEIQPDSRVITKKGKNVTAAYQQGASEALKLAQMFGATKAILKANSPMCGSGQIYDGTFTGLKVKGDGVFARALKSHGIEIEVF